MHWAMAFRLVLIALLLTRLARDCVQVRRRAIPVTRLVVPLLVLLAAVLVANHVLPRRVALAALVALDVAFLAVCCTFIWSARGDLEKALSKFFPEWFARFAVTDLIILSHAVAGARAFIDPGRATMHSYIQGSKIVMAAIVMAVAVIPDAIFLWLLIPHKLWWLALLLDALDIWTCLWLFGIYGTMARRPHELSPHQIVLRNGIWESVEIDPQHIEGAEVLGVAKCRTVLRRGEPAAFLSFGGVPLIDVRLGRPARAIQHFARGPRDVTRIVAASDSPGFLCAELRKLSKPLAPAAAHVVPPLLEELPSNS